MARLDWTPIAIPNIGADALQAQSMAGRSIQEALQGFTGVLGQWEGSRRDANMAELLARQEAFAGGDPSLYDAARKSGALTRGLSYIRPEALATSVRTFGADLERDYRGDIAFADNRTDRAFTLDERTRAATERTAGIAVARGRERIRSEVAAGRMSEEQAARETEALVGQAATAAQITDGYSAIREGTQDNRGNVTWDRGTTNYNDSRVDRRFMLDQREAEQQALTLAQKYVNFEGTNEDLMNDPEYKRATPLAQSLALERLGRAAPQSFSGTDPVGGGGSVDGADWTAASGMAASESGGRWSIVNGEGYGGRNQFGDARLADAARAGIVPRGTTAAQFARMAPDVQRRTEQWHWNDIDQQSARMGLTRYIGQTIGGVRITEGAIRGMAQIGGIGGAQRFITSGGRYNPLDSNGTSIADYGKRFSAAPVGPQATTMAVGAAVARSRDPAGPGARRIFAGLSNDTPTIDVIRAATAAGGEGTPAGPFAGMDSDRVGRIIREVQDRHHRLTGGRLPAAAAVEIAAQSMTQYDFAKDGWRNLIGRSTGVGSTGGLFSTARQTLNWTDVDARVRQAANPGQLAEDVRNDSRRATVAANAPVYAQQISQLEQQIADREARGLGDNPVTDRMKVRLGRLRDQWGSFAGPNAAALAEDLR
jgi:hypothetical protein